MAREEAVSTVFLIALVLSGCGQPDPPVDIEQAVTEAVPARFVLAGSERDRQPIEAEKGGPGRRLVVDLFCSPTDVKIIAEKLLQTVRLAISNAGLVIIDEELQLFNGQLVGFSYYIANGKCAVEGRVYDRLGGHVANGSKLFRVTISIRTFG